MTSNAARHVAISVSLPLDLIDGVTIEAQEQGVSRSKLITEFITQGLMTAQERDYLKVFRIKE
ncbi:MAG TPA: hypothetical protein VGG75_06290 [Trebonia sp.]|jgi:metal-responsive CopG/Arc/MetJ family transcriptional regulator